MLSWCVKVLVIFPHPAVQYKQQLKHFRTTSLKYSDNKQLGYAVLSCVNRVAINLCVFIQTVAKGIINLTMDIPTRYTDLRQTKEVCVVKQN